MDEPNPSSSLDSIGKCFETPTASLHQIEQQVEKVTQNIANRLVNHINQQVGRLETIVSRNTNLNVDKQNNNRTDIFHPVQVTQDVASCIDKHVDFHPKPPKLNFLAGRRYLVNTRLASIDGFSK